MINVPELLIDISFRLSQIDEKTPPYVERVRPGQEGEGVTYEAAISLKYRNIPLPVWDKTLLELAKVSPYPVKGHYVSIRPGINVTLLLD